VINKEELESMKVSFVERFDGKRFNKYKNKRATSYYFW
jgi:hypothetical protein